MLLVGIWHGDLSAEAVDDIVNSNQYVILFLGWCLEDNVPDHLVLSLSRIRFATVAAWDDWNRPINKFKRTMLL